MNNLKIFSIAVCSIAIFTSCTKDLDQLPISSQTTDNFFTTKNDFIQANNAMYSTALRGTAGSSYGYPDRQLNLSETRSDNLYAITDGARDWEGINGLQTTISINSYVKEAWQSNFKAIDKINLFLQKLQADGRQIIADDSLSRRFYADAKFLRAFCYFDLVRWFGKVPIVENTVTAQQATTIPRSSVADVYNFIEADLQSALDSMPNVANVFTATEKGRANRWAIKYLMALAKMTKSSPTYGIEGPGLGANEWSQAYTLLNELTGSGSPFSFQASYPNIYSYTNENNSEVIFDVQYYSVTSGTSQGLGASFVWILTPDGYFQSLGLSAQGANYQRPISNDFLSKFPAADARRVFGVQTGYTYQSTTVNYSFYKKYIDKTKYGSGGRNDWPINFIVGTYTDALLLKAECTLHGGGGTQAEVDASVNRVRTRAGLASLSNVSLDSLFEERRREFHGEGKRWHDLVRSGKIIDIMNAWIAADDASNHRINPMVANFIIYPIPIAEMNAAPGLYTQNPGYD
ncbi:MAG: RagB/SusD family nutrient uptake outer membrane protein [Ferruginibacter sp.]